MMIELRERRLGEDIERALHSLRPLPHVARELLTISSTSDIPLQRIVDLIEYDPVLAARIVRLANSTFFGLRRRVSTIKDAVIVLGIQGVRNLAIGVALLPDPDANEVFGLKLSAASGLNDYAFLDHTLAVAITARRIAAILDPASADEAFLAGLIHDLGKPFLAAIDPETYCQVLSAAAERHCDPAVLEREAFGCDHGEIAGRLCELWNLPPSLARVVRMHHEPGQKGPIDLALAGANALTQLLEIGASGNTCLDAAALRALLRSSLTLEQLNDLALNLPAEVAEACHVYGSCGSTFRPPLESEEIRSRLERLGESGRSTSQESATALREEQ